MTAPSTAAVGSVCPDCAAPLPGRPQRCDACGLPLTGAVAVELYQLDLALASMATERERLLARRPGLLARLRSGETAPAGTDPAAAPQPRPSAGRGVQDLLLGLGVAALLVGALVFVSVAWSVLGVAGQVLVLLAVTAGVAAGARWAHRRGLGATAESLAVLAVGLSLADLYAARSLDLAGLGDLPFAAYWSGALAVLAAAAGLLGRGERGGAAYPALAVAAAAVSAGIALGEVEPRGLRAALLLVAAVLAGGGTRVLGGAGSPRLRPAGLVATAATAVLAVAALVQAWSAMTEGTLSGRVSGTAVGLGLAAVPYLGAVRSSSGEWGRPLRLTAVAVAAGTLWIDVLPLDLDGVVGYAGPGMRGLALGALLLAVALLLRPRVRERSRAEAALLEVAAPTAALAGLSVLVDGTAGARLLELLALSAAAAALAVLRPATAAATAPAALGLLALSSVTAGNLHWGELTDALVLLSVALLAVGVAGWRLGRAEEPGSAIVAAAAALGAFGLALEAGPELRGGALVAGIVAASALGYALLPGRGRVAVVGVAAASTTTWLLEHDAGVSVVEAYSLPLAAMLAGLGFLHHRRAPAVGTWLTAGPALSAALLPTAVVSVDDPGFTRAALALVLGAALVTVGGWRGWLAPTLTGTAAVLLVLVSRGAPVVAEVPQWVTLTVVGAALVAVGATYEQRRRELASAGRWVAALR